MFRGATNKNDDAFRDHCGNWKKYLVDANPGSLEKCLDALNAYIDKADPKLVAVSQNDVIKTLIEKCLGHAKPTIKAKSLECFLLTFEVSEVFDDPTTIETFTEMLGNKQQKVS